MLFADLTMVRATSSRQQRGFVLRFIDQKIIDNTLKKILFIVLMIFFHVSEHFILLLLVRCSDTIHLTMIKAVGNGDTPKPTAFLI